MSGIPVQPMRNLCVRAVTIELNYERYKQFAGIFRTEDRTTG